MTSERGMTLVEVLVALAIVAVALVAGGQAFGALTRQTERSQTMWLAQLCADNALVAHKLQTQMPPIGTQTGSCEQAGVRMGTRSTITPTPNPSFRRVEVSVLDADGHTLLNLSGLLGRY